MTRENPVMKKAASLLCMCLLLGAAVARAEQGTESFTKIELVQSGGLAGVRKSYVIGADGSYRVTQRGTTTKEKLSPERLQALRKAFRAVEWDKVPAVKTTQGAADLFQYDIVVTF